MEIVLYMLLFMLPWLLINHGIILVDAASIEPICSKFSYDEQLLEKMIRMEFHVENQEKEWKKALSDEVKHLTENLGDQAEKLLKVNETTKILLQQLGNTNSEVDAVTKDSNTMKEKFDESQRKISTLEAALEKKLETVYNKLIELQGSISIPRIAFNAREAADLSLEPNQVIVFKTVINNYGNAYKPEEGIFYAPYNGIYQFNAHLCVVHTGELLDYAIMVEDTLIVAGEYMAPSKAEDGKCIGFSAAGVVNKTQKVAVTYRSGQSYTRNILFQNDNDWNSFSGVLLNTLPSS